MKKARKRLGSLTVAETQRLLGSKKPVSIGKLPTNPSALRMFAPMVRERLISRGGRPSDPAWTIVRKIPMRPETWKEFSRCAEELQGHKIYVSAGQIAAITLERGLQTTKAEHRAVEHKVQQNEFPYEISELAMVQAARAYEVSFELYQCG